MVVLYRKQDLIRLAAESLTITNISISGTLQKKIILEKIPTKSKLLKRPYWFPAVKGKFIQDAKTGRWVDIAKVEGAPRKGPSYLIFSSGCFIGAGIKNLDMAKDIIAEIKNDLKRCGYKVKPVWNVQNIAFSGGFPCPLNLDVFLGNRVKNMIYEPEVFPGARYKFPGKKARSITLYSTGKFILNGIRCQNIASAYKSARRMIKELVENIPLKVFVQEKKKK